MGGPPVTSRGGMVHLILSLCRQFEEAFGKAVDGGKGGGEQILRVFEERLGQNIQQLQFKKVSMATSLQACASAMCGSIVLGYPACSQYSEIVLRLATVGKALRFCISSVSAARTSSEASTAKSLLQLLGDELS